MTEATNTGKRQVQEVTTSHGVATTLTPGWTLDSIAQTVMEKIAEYFHPDSWSLLTVDEQRRELMYLVKKTTRVNMGVAQRGVVNT